MPRPKNKQELLDLSEVNFEKLNVFIDGLSTQDQNSDFPIGTMNRNIRDVLIHLHHWHLLLLKWYRIGMSGEKPEMPDKGYTWKTLPEYNRMVLEKYQDIPLIVARAKYEESHLSILNVIHSHTNEELFEKKRYKWTSSTSMGAYFISATSSHYEWALELIKKAFRNK